MVVRTGRRKRWNVEVGDAERGIGLLGGLNQGATMWLTWLLGLAGLTSIVLASMLPRWFPLGSSTRPRLSR